MILENYKYPEVITSTPGKVLICGGYLVINPKYSGLVISTDVKFNCVSKINKNENSLKRTIRFEVISKEYNLIYNYNVKMLINKFIISNVGKNENNYILNSIKAAIFILDLTEEQIIFFENKIINIELLPDYRFYSYNPNYERDGKFNIKTGLGSSSALICTIVTNIICLFRNISGNLRSLPDKFQSEILLASMLANNVAQNKIGSGFDIYSCLFGSQIFKRYIIKTELINKLQEDLIDSKIDSSLLSEIEGNIISRLNFISFPKNLKVCLVSVECGSDTRIFVSKVMKWAEENKKNEIFDDDIFQNINKSNEKLITLLNCEELSSEKMQELKYLCKVLREDIQLLSKKSQIEIEPEILSNLMNQLLQESEILFTICPGAGGYDGIFVMGTYEDFKNKVENVLTIFNSINVSFKAYYLPINFDDKGTMTYIKQ